MKKILILLPILILNFNNIQTACNIHVNDRTRSNKYYVCKRSKFVEKCCKETNGKLLVIKDMTGNIILDVDCAKDSEHLEDFPNCIQNIEDKACCIWAGGEWKD